jgi:site-specific DNA-methyltransferase (adenine-specific)
MTPNLRLGRWQDVLADVSEVDAVITDPPYSARVHEGHDDGAETANRPRRRKANGVLDTGRARRPLSYDSWSMVDVQEFVGAWAARNRGWFVCLSDSELCGTWRAAFKQHGLTGFAPVPLLLPGMTVRLCGDGPSSWAVYANVGRPKALAKWGTLPGGYHGPPHDRAGGGLFSLSVVGAKPLWAMRALVRDYTRPGDLVCDPCAGGGTTLLAAAIEGRRSIGAECDPDTFAKAQRRLTAGYTPVFPGIEAL